jgi:L-threonylcarbamoyladenylate synthase
MTRPLDDAVRALARGQVVVYPTDTLYGLGARASDRSAVQKVMDLKGRPEGMPISVAVSSTEEIESWADLAERSRAIVRRELPGPVTLLLPANRNARRSFGTPIVSPNGTIGIRVPDHPLARELARRSGPITATSANRHGEAPAMSIPEARRVFQGDIRLYLDDPVLPRGRPSRLIDLTGTTPRSVER